MIERKNIGIDVDSVLNTLDHEWSAWVRLHHDPGFTLDKWLSWGVHEHTTAGHNVYAFLGIPGIFGTLGVRDDAVRVTQRLSQHHNLFPISACLNFEVAPDKSKWLAKNFPHIPHANIFFCMKKSMVDVDILIDDGAHNFDDFRETPLLFDSPWNRHATHLDDNRVKGWLGIEQWMEKSGLL